MPSARELVAAGDPKAALASLQQEVRGRAADPKLRVFLFQLLCVLGQWQRALTQLQLCGEMDSAALAMVATYRDAVHCEAVRESVFAGQTLPHVFGRPQAWVAWLAEALQADGRGEKGRAVELRARAFDAAVETSGSLNEQPFEWIADADSRLGPVLEAVINGRYCWVPFATLLRVSIEPPSDLRDLVWAPANLGFTNGGESVALLPVRYAGSAASDDAALQLARRTDWIELGDGQYRGVGQRLLATDAGEAALLTIRAIALDAPTEASDELVAGA